MLRQRVQQAAHSVGPLIRHMGKTGKVISPVEDGNGKFADQLVVYGELGGGGAGIEDQQMFQGNHSLPVCLFIVAVGRSITQRNKKWNRKM